MFTKPSNALKQDYIKDDYETYIESIESFNFLLRSGKLSEAEKYGEHIGLVYNDIN